MYPASNPRRVIPQKNRKKNRKETIDLRPHKKPMVIHGCVIEQSDYSEEHAKGMLSHRNAEHWTKEEIHALIEQHNIILGFSPKVRTKLNKLASFILRKLQKSNFCCELTGVPLFGGVGFGPRGIGIDLRCHNLGVQKHNIRLISAPLAIARFFHMREPKIIMNGSEFKDEILFAIAKHLQWALQSDRHLRYLPIDIKIGANGNHFVHCLGVTPSFNDWYVDNHYEYTCYKRICISYHKIVDVSYHGDILKVDSFNGTYIFPPDARNVKILPLCDPTIDLIGEIVRSICDNYRTLLRYFVHDRR